MAVRGYVDGVLGRFVVGWAHDPDDPGRRTEVSVELDGEIVGHARADLARGDLEAAGIGDGQHAFRVELPSPLAPGSEHVLTVRTRAGQVPLQFAEGCVVELTDGSTGPPPRLRPAASSPSRSPAARRLPDRALLGSGGWLFELGDLSVLRRVVGQEPLPSGEIERQRDRLVSRHRRLAALGIAYVVAAVPDKATLYAEQLPAGLEPSAPGERGLSAVAASLRDVNGIELLDLLPALRDARRHGLLLPPAAAGWTWLGAFAAYRALAKDLAKRLPDIEPHTPDALRLGVEVPVEPALAVADRVALVGTPVPVPIGEDEQPETEPDLDRAGLAATYLPLARDLEEVVGPGSSLLECPTPDVTAGAVVVHDGSAARIATFLAEHFSRTLIAACGEIPWPAIELESPAVVVQLVAERELCSPLR